jgi:hypothetical protein
VKCLEFENLKTKMSKFGWMNTKSWKLKTKIWNLFVKCLEEIWKFENWNVWILNIENWNVCKLKTENWNV